ncbi:MAG: tryptophan synthase subunit alpha [Terriglobales bacterium]
MSRFASIFAASTKQPRALIPYLTVGDPSLDTSRDIALALATAGADIIELGVPFSDPVADGPVIQAASQRALARGVHLEDVLATARAIRQHSEVGLLLFSYYNPVLRYGLEAFARDAAAAGCDGVLITDLIPEEAAAYRGFMQAAGLDTVFLVAPTSPPERLHAIAAASTGFIYAVSRLGVTGGTTTAGAGEHLIAALRRHTSLPVAVGFGITNAAQVAAVAAYADGAVVGSALVQAIASAAAGTEPVAAAQFLKGLRHGHC